MSSTAKDLFGDTDDDDGDCNGVNIQVNMKNLFRDSDDSEDGNDEDE